MQRPARTLPTNIIAQTLRGVMYPIEALGFIFGNNLWGLAAVAVVINVVLLALLFIITGYYVVPLLTELDAKLMGASDAAWVQPLLAALSWIVWIVGGFLVVSFNAIVLLVIIRPF